MIIKVDNSHLAKPRNDRPRSAQAKVATIVPDTSTTGTETYTRTFFRVDRHGYGGEGELLVGVIYGMKERAFKFAPRSPSVFYGLC